MTDTQWAIVEPLLPPPGNTTDKGGRPEKHPRRIVLDAIFYLARGGIAWRQMPSDFPPAMTIYGTFHRWAKTGMATGSRRAARPGPRPRWAPTVAHRRDHRLPNRTWCRHRTHDEFRLRRRQKTKGRKRHIAVDTLGLLSPSW
jgi:hypothetical protein